ncbi:MAG TPA: hypothetical protein VF997_20915, partial [Polyangia bacterium]
YDSATATSNSGSLDVETAFACIAAVGEKGCGFPAPLEALELAVRPSVNPGFLRSDALLVVVLLAGADDCSAPPDTTLFDPSPAGVAQWGVLHPFRCTQWGIACDGAALGGGALPPTSHCVPVAGGPLFDVARYQALLAPGGVKSASDDLVLATLVAPPAPLSVRVTMPCADDSAAPSCPILDHACVAPTDPSLFADPAVRIDAVSAAVPNAIAGPACDADDTPTLDAVGDAIAARMGGACLPGAVVDLADPGCAVFVGGVETPRCDSQGRRPCWNVVDDASCSVHLTPAGNPQTLRLSLQGAPAGAAIDAHCPLYEPGA